MGLIHEGNTAFGVDADTWQEAVRAGGELLRKNGCATAEYVDAMIANTVENGPYYVLVPGVAMPHASSSAGVLKLGVSLITLARPLRFLDSPNNPVDLVICLAAEDGEEHLSLLTKMSELLMDDSGALDQLRRSTCVKDVLDIFNP